MNASPWLLYDIVSFLSIIPLDLCLSEHSQSSDVRLNVHAKEICDTVPSFLLLLTVMFIFYPFQDKKILYVYFIVLKIYFMCLGIPPAQKCECHRSAVSTESRKGRHRSWNWSYSCMWSAVWVLRTGCGSSVRAVGLLTIGSLLQSLAMSLSLILGPFVVQWTLTGKRWMRGSVILVPSGISLPIRVCRTQEEPWTTEINKLKQLTNQPLNESIEVIIGFIAM